MHHQWLDEGVLLADTKAIQILQQAGWSCYHMGFGDFQLGAHGRLVEFVRKDGGATPPSWPGIEGRPHQVYGDPQSVLLVKTILEGVEG